MPFWIIFPPFILILTLCDSVHTCTLYLLEKKGYNFGRGTCRAENMLAIQQWQKLPCTERPVSWCSIKDSMMMEWTVKRFLAWFVCRSKYLEHMPLDQCCSPEYTAVYSAFRFLQLSRFRVNSLSHFNYTALEFWTETLSLRCFHLY